MLGLPFWLGILFTAQTRAEPTQPVVISNYQELLVHDARIERGLEIEPNPEGKRIEKIIYATLNVFVRQDPWPEFPNAIHVITHDEVIERELLFEAGDAWDPALVAETARNLRSNLFVSIARVEPCKGTRPDSVIALVLTKDMWSFRPAVKFTLVGSTLQNFEIFLAEYNLAGRLKTFGLDAGLDLSTFWFGQQLRDPRIGGTRISFKERADLIWNKTTGLPEGGIVNLELERPLFRIAEQWGWKQLLDYRRDIFRLYQGSTLVTVPLSTGETYALDYRRQELRWEGTIEHSTGTREHKTNVSGGVRVWSKLYSQVEPGISSAGQNEFANTYLPFSEGAVSVFGRVRQFHPIYRQVSNIEKFALTEDMLEGPDYEVDLQWAMPVPGLLGGFGELRARHDWTLKVGEDDYFTWGGTWGTRYQVMGGTDLPWTNQLANVRIRNVSPRILGLFRVLTSVRVTRRIRDLTRAIEMLGGESALRGYPSGYYFGNETWGANFELRSVPWVYRTLHLGAVAFVDVGDAYGFLRTSQVHASVGFGFRMAFPQFNRSLMRLDFGFPLENLAPYSPSYVTFTFGQAFF